LTKKHAERGQLREDWPEPFSKKEKGHCENGKRGEGANLSGASQKKGSGWDSEKWNERFLGVDGEIALGREESPKDKRMYRRTPKTRARVQGKKVLYIPRTRRGGESLLRKKKKRKNREKKKTIEVF